MWKEFPCLWNSKTSKVSISIFVIFITNIICMLFVNILSIGCEYTWKLNEQQIHRKVSLHGPAKRRNLIKTVLKVQLYLPHSHSSIERKLTLSHLCSFRDDGFYYARLHFNNDQDNNDREFAYSCILFYIPPYLLVYVLHAIPSFSVWCILRVLPVRFVVVVVLAVPQFLDPPSLFLEFSRVCF